MDSSADLLDLEKEIIARLGNDRCSLNLSYRTAWDLKTAKFSLDSNELWRRAVEQVGAKLSKSPGFSGSYHIQVFHYLDEIADEKGKKGKGSDKVGLLALGIRLMVWLT